ncbi:SagB/ThcOx family dehydrogenase [Streptomyces sp. NPDC058614]|uniref:SagB/ThcOx family dehydrogenase n=1 Tax=Streptomyces sp. NPDC058614 TaxID=3346557 RepID=UPI0036546EAD
MASNFDEEYHIASRNSAVTKNVRSAHLIHYAPHIDRLVATAPLRIQNTVGSRIHIDNAPVLDQKLEDVLAARVSSRDFGGSITVAELWRLCYVATGVRESNLRQAGTRLQRHAPNSGGMGSVEAFPIVMNVDGIARGLYHFDSISHDFAGIELGDFRQWLREDVIFQEEFSRAAVAIVLVGSFKSLREKYGVRGYRLCLIDTGHVSENVYLAATSLGLNVCATTGFIDDEVDEALQIDGVDRASLILIMVGRSGYSPSI